MGSTGTAAYVATCMDPRDTDITRGLTNKQLHLLKQFLNGGIVNPVADHFKKMVLNGDIAEALQNILVHRGACAGGGWSLEAFRDIYTQLANGLEPAAFYSVRHKNCASILMETHYTDPDVACMITIDRDRLGLNHVPVYRAHFDIVAKEEVFEASPMPLEALVAHAIVYGTGSFFPNQQYDKDLALSILGLNQLSEYELIELADQIQLSSKMLLEPQVPLQVTHAH